MDIMIFEIPIQNNMEGVDAIMKINDLLGRELKYHLLDKPLSESDLRIIRIWQRDGTSEKTNFVPKDRSHLKIVRCNAG